MFTVSVASGQLRPEQNIYICVSTPGSIQHKSNVSIFKEKEAQDAPFSHDSLEGQMI